MILRQHIPQEIALVFIDLSRVPTITFIDCAQLYALTSFNQ